MSEAPGTGPPQPPAGPSRPDGARPARYPRTTNGLIGSLVVTLLAIGAFVALRSLNRDELEVEQPPIDYLATVTQVQEGGFDIVYPESLPQGWTAYTLDYVPGERPAWGLGIHAEDGRFVGLRQEDEDLDDLLDTYVDEDTQDESPVRVTGSVAREWRAFSDEGGDTAYAAEVGGDTVVVYGSADPADLRTLLGLLTTERR